MRLTGRQSDDLLRRRARPAQYGLVRARDHLDHCESVEDLADLARDEAGDLRLVVIEQDDEYAAIVRVDEPDDEVRAFLTDGHAADAYPIAAAVAEDLVEIGDDDPPDDDGILADTPLTHDQRAVR